MNKLFGIILLFTAYTLLFNVGYCWTIGTKGNVVGPVIHTTYFLTPNNNPYDVHALAYVGFFINNSCQYNIIYDLGTEKLATGDYVDIDAFALKDVIGNGYSCLTIYYTYKQLVRETYQIIWDGANYNTSIPAVSEVKIL